MLKALDFINCLRELFAKKNSDLIKENTGSGKARRRNNIMPNKEYLDNVMKLLAPLGSISVKSMFGGYKLTFSRGRYVCAYLTKG